MLTPCSAPAAPPPVLPRPRPRKRPQDAPILLDRGIDPSAAQKSATRAHDTTQGAC